MVRPEWLQNRKTVEEIANNAEYGASRIPSRSVSSCPVNGSAITQKRPPLAQKYDKIYAVIR